VLQQIGHFERFAELYGERGVDLGADELYWLLMQQFPNRFDRGEVEILSGKAQLVFHFSIIEEVLRELLERGVFATPVVGLDRREDSTRPILQLWHWRGAEKVYEPLSASEIIEVGKVKEHIRHELSVYGLDPELKAAATLLVEKFVLPTAVYNPTLTDALRKEARNSVAPQIKQIDKGETIISEGEIVSREKMKIITALLERKPKLDIRESLAIAFYLAGIFFLSYIMFAPLIKHGRRTYQHAYILLSSAVLFTLNLFVLLTFSLLPPMIPMSLAGITALVSMMVATLITHRVGIITSLMLSLFFFCIPDVDPYAFVFSFLSGITATYLIRNAEKRIDLVSATVKLALVVTAILITIGLFQQMDPRWYLSATGLGIFHAFATGALNLAILPALEHLLNAPTVFRLRELSDTNTPLFRRMITAAPGTYSHSMSVANLAESACREIGANHLLARVGAYYHDIGKMDQPDYFIENQDSKNKHDEMSPNLSVAVIKSHVKIGKERAKELKLPPEVVEIVADHHGSDVIGYFYQQALKKRGENVNQSEFSYNGTPPRSREAAVVMLADTIEAQSRTVKKPTMQKFEKMVWATIMDKIGRKQLSNSFLSFQDLEKIKNSFVQILAGQFHNRIEYPEQKVK